jgi:hypothetical protein
MTKRKQLSRLTKALPETTDDMRRSGVIGTVTRDKIKMRHLSKVVNGRTRIEAI